MGLYRIISQGYLHQNEPVAEPESVHHHRDINTAGTFSAAAEDEEAAVSENIIMAGLRIQSTYDALAN